MTSEQFKKKIRVATAEKGISGVMELAEISGVSYFKASKAWNGDKTITIVDLEAVLDALDLTWDFISKDQ